MASGDDKVRQQIERSIEVARDEISGRIDDLDRKLRTEFNLNKIASEHAIQLMGAGAAIGFVFGVGVPRAILRLIQIGVPIGIAVAVAKRVHEASDEEMAETGDPAERAG
jgi:hypothetical protein